MVRGPPAFERFPDKALRYHFWEGQTRHMRGDAYPLYTLDTLRNLADHLFDFSGWHDAPARARRVQPCDLVYTTLRTTEAFNEAVHYFCFHAVVLYATKHHDRQVNENINVPYILITDNADTGIAWQGDHIPDLISSPNIWRWFAVDNEVLDVSKIESLPVKPPPPPSRPSTLSPSPQTPRTTSLERRHSIHRWCNVG